MEEIQSASRLGMEDLNSFISLNEPTHTHVGWDPDIAPEHQNSVYPSIVNASKITGLCINKILYAVFNQPFSEQQCLKIL